MTRAISGIITFRGVVYPAQCDAIGHMNVQHYTAAFDQAMWHLVFELGFHPSWVTERHEGWADVRHQINFRRELRLGQLFHAESALVKIGNTSLVTAHRIVETESGEIAAEAEITSVYFDLQQRQSRPIPAQIRSAAADALTTASPTAPGPRV